LPQWMRAPPEISFRSLHAEMRAALAGGDHP
jgi:hypothetical protein